MRTFALLATAEYCLFCIALRISVFKVHINLLTFQDDLDPLLQFHFLAKDKHWS